MPPTRGHPASPPEAVPFERDTGSIVTAAPPRDKTGRLTRAFARFREKVKETDELRQQQVIAEKQAQEERRAALPGFANEFEQSVGTAVEALAEEVRKVSHSAEEMSESAHKSASGTEQVNTAAGVAAENVQTVAAAAQELTSSVMQEKAETVRREVKDFLHRIRAA
jgi:methyl-accepting chemotaxis protein